MDEILNALLCNSLYILKGDPSAVSSRDIELGSFFTVILLQPTLRYKSLYNTQNSKKVRSS